MAPTGIVMNSLLLKTAPVLGQQQQTSDVGNGASNMTTSQRVRELENDAYTMLLSRTVSNTLLQAAKYLLPLLAVLSVLGLPVVELLFQRSGFDGDASAMVAGLIPWYCLAIMPMVLRDVLLRVAYSRQARLIVLWAGMAGVASKLLFGGLFVQVLQWGLPGLLVASAIAYVCVAAILHAWLRKQGVSVLTTRWGAGNMETIVALARCGAASIVGAWVASSTYQWLSQHALIRSGGGDLLALVGKCAALGASAAVGLLSSLWCGNLGS